MTKKEASNLDKILSDASNKNYAHQVKPEENSLCHKLQLHSYIEIMIEDPVGYLINMTEKGNQFIAGGGFQKLLENETFEKEFKKKTTRLAILANIISSLALLVSIAAFFREELFNFFK